MGSVVAGPGIVLDVTLSLDISGAYADNDVLAATQEIKHAFLRQGGRAILDTVILLDEDDNAQDVDLVFLSADNALGTENMAVSITDAHARDIIGVVSVATADYCDLVGCQVATKRDLGLHMQAGSSSTSLFIGAILRSGTPTYTAAGIKLKLALRWLA
jgi:hypothetical protein